MVRVGNNNAQQQQQQQQQQPAPPNTAEHGVSRGASVSSSNNNPSPPSPRKFLDSTALAEAAGAGGGLPMSIFSGGNTDVSVGRVAPAHLSAQNFTSGGGGGAEGAFGVSETFLTQHPDSMGEADSAVHTLLTALTILHSQVAAVAHRTREDAEQSRHRAHSALQAVRDALCKCLGELEPVFPFAGEALARVPASSASSGNLSPFLARYRVTEGSAVVIPSIVQALKTEVEPAGLRRPRSLLYPLN